ncbi:MAG: UDP-N-acetylmuramoyl-L-alanyl-D-glutamate--2,6-diaminopimelate ligase [Clostridia bacterium]|nr:UDP-N-acetylmuramoyl-L-alanyl-D-glutamate--2,6-diaminopimelate ligase [Clostridia bacterium]
MKLKSILSKTNADIEISGIAYNSRLVKKGDAFVAIKGYRTDGHKYAKNAEENGAVCVVCMHKIDGLKIPCIIVDDTRKALAEMAEKYYDNPTSKLKLIGVTGTNGKTTVTYLVKNILEANGEKVGLIGTNKNMIGQEEFHTERTTPEALEMMQLFDKMVKEGCAYAVMEVSSHSLDLHRVDGCHYEVGAFTNLTQDHLDFHGTMENYMNAKAKLFKMCKYGVINADDKYGNKIAEKASCAVATFGIDDGDLKAENIIYHESGIEFDCEGMKIQLGIPGRFSVYNALTAISICKLCGISNDIIEKAMKSAKGVKGRAEIVDCGGDYTLIIDYAHTSDGLENILKSVKGFAKGRIVVVFGCGGDRDKTKRPKMGRVAGQLADLCIITSDNPRSEEPSEIIRDILAGMNDAIAEYVVIENRRDAIEYAIKHAKTNDVIILAGKGHEDYQVLKDKTIHFDEREVVKEILNKM